MKPVLTILLFIFPSILFAQRENEFQFFEVKNDTLVLFLDRVGTITTKSKAEFYRKSFMEIESFNYKWFVEDFYMNNQMAFQCMYKNEFMMGPTKEFYANGQFD